MKAVEFDAGVEAIGQGLDNLLAHKRLSPVCRDVNKDHCCHQERKDDSTDPKWPAGYASARDPGFRKLHLWCWMPFVRLADPFSD
jgi:hypothetical protein